jgi:hypothetical protein
VSLGTSGDIDVKPTGVVTFRQAGDFILDAGNGNTNSITNEGILSHEGSVNGGPDPSATVLELRVVNNAATSRLYCASGTLVIDDTTDTWSVDQSNGRTIILPESVLQLEDHYRQTGGQFVVSSRVIVTGTIPLTYEVRGGEAVVVGDLNIDGGDLRFEPLYTSPTNQLAAVTLSCRFLKVTGTASILMRVGITVDEESPPSNDLILALGQIRLGANTTLRIEDMGGDYDPNDYFHIMAAELGITGDFANKYYGWVGTTGLSPHFSATIIDEPDDANTYRLTVPV